MPRRPSHGAIEEIAGRTDLPQAPAYNGTRLREVEPAAEFFALAPARPLLAGRRKGWMSGAVPNGISTRASTPRQDAVPPGRCLDLDGRMLKGGGSAADKQSFGNATD
jgi:hypothetical protein